MDARRRPKRAGAIFGSAAAHAPNGHPKRRRRDVGRAMPVFLVANPKGGAVKRTVAARMARDFARRDAT
jgi:hypothetical protein